MDKFARFAPGRPSAPPAEGSPLPALVLVHGGLVPPEDSPWLAESLAACGWYGRVSLGAPEAETTAASAPPRP